jgi:alpha-L-fucosidase
MTRRQLLKLLAASAPALAAGRSRLFAADTPVVPGSSPVRSLPIAPGPFTGTRESLAAGYEVPQWWRDAKFGIWAHWGPQSAAEYGDWYARNIYIDKSSQHKHHVAKYGHPSKFGYKDIIPLWTGEHFDPDHLVGLYKKAGAQYFVSLAVHCDNVDLWDSTHNRWNSVKMGPKRDIVGEFSVAARKHGLRFGVSDHLWPASKWISVCRGSDTMGELAGVPYDGGDPAYADFYGDYPFPDRKLDWNEDGITEATKDIYFRRIKDLIDKYDFDYIYQDGHIPFGDRGLALLAHLYNQSIARNSGRLDMVYTSKELKDTEDGACVLDFERALPETIWPRPFQICTCIGAWHYDVRKLGNYKTPKRVIDMLVDTVSRNGNLLLNFPLRRDGTLDDEEKGILAAITDWMAIHADAIHGTRPWVMFGEGPGMVRNDPTVKYNESLRQDFVAADVRFTTRGRDLFAFVMGVPEAGKPAIVAPLAPTRGLARGRIEHVELLGYGGRITWRVDEQAGLIVNLPQNLPSTIALVFRVKGVV